METVARAQVDDEGDANHSTPTLTIVLPLEGRPRVHEEAMHEGDSRRLEDWIKSQPALLQLVKDALLLQARRAA